MAQLDHIHWKNLLVKGIFLRNGEKNSDGSIVGGGALDARDCMLGKWYYGLGREFAGSPGYIELEQPHARLHKLGNVLVEARKQGLPKAELFTIIKDINTLSAEIIMLLQEMEHAHLLMSMD